MIFSFPKNKMGVDPIIYLTFWAVTAFSFFTGIDEITSDALRLEASQPTLLCVGVFLRSTVHSIALGVLIIAITEVFRSSSTERWIATRPKLIEQMTAVAGFALVAVSFVVSIEDAFDATDNSSDRQLLFPCKIIPWVGINLWTLRNVMVIWQLKA